MTAQLTPYQFERLIKLLDEKFKETDLAFYCGLRNNLTEQLQKETEKSNELLDKYFSAPIN